MAKVLRRVKYKHVILGAIVITLVSAFRKGWWDTAFISGVGYGFPWLWFRVATWSDAGGIATAGDQSVAVFLGTLSFAGNLIFWFGFLHLVLWITTALAHER